MNRVKVRFAPSPTGYLHVGNARIALINWLFARHFGGVFQLRLDDTDTERSREEFAQAILADLRWLGLDWDEFFRQSERLARYAEAAEALKKTGRLYPCFETEEELAAKREARRRRGLAPIYDRAALKLSPEAREAAIAAGRQPYWRFLLSDGVEEWDDLVLGRRRVKLSAISDPVLIRADGTPLYTFCSVVDDLDTEITHIIRGEDHISNTGVQRDIMAALGADPNRLRYAHLPLLKGTEGEKLSKRLESLSIRSLARDGVLPEALVAYLASLGSSRDPELAPLASLIKDFDLARFSASAARFDIRQLLSLNRRLLHNLPFASVADRLPAGANESFWLAVRGNIELLNEARGWWEVIGGTIVPPPMTEEREFLRTAIALLPPEPWHREVWQDWTSALQAATGRRGRALYQPLRLALTGEEHGPELAALLPLMGRARVLQRLELAAS
ncbi:MAG: glutamate--tRNA ligase [Acetobacteraceae bacterium]|nr:glutamate--tRNA ligase [Acetobacteraceae bacterium]